MRIPPTPRRAGARSKPIHFQYVGVEKGQPFEAYLAGPVWWGYLHMTKPSKPCVYEVTQYALACRFCAAGEKMRVPVVKGWVPLYLRVGGDAVMVPVDEAQRDAIDELKPFTKVTVGRGKGKVAGVWVQPCVNQEPKWSSTLPERMEPADVTESLLTVWKLPELLTFFCAGDKPLSLDKAETRDGAAATREHGQEHGQEHERKRDHADTNDLFAATVNRARGRADALKPSTNGKH